LVRVARSPIALSLMPVLFDRDADQYRLRQARVLAKTLAIAPDGMSEAEPVPADMDDDAACARRPIARAETPNGDENCAAVTPGTSSRFAIATRFQSFRSGQRMRDRS
jgi:hypothetical protein